MSTELSLDPVRVANAPALPGLVFRRFRGADDFPAMMRVLSASEIADGNERVITLEEIANTYAHLTNSDPDRDVLMAEVAGQLVA